MTTIRVSETNYHRLQQFAVPLEDTADDALGRVLDLAEEAKRSGLSVELTGKIGKQTTNANRPDIKLTAKLSAVAVPAKEGSTMTRWQWTRTGERFWLTKAGTPCLFLTSRDSWLSDTEHKVIHHPIPKSGWDRYDRLYLRGDGDVDYALKVLGDLDTPGKSLPKGG